MPTILDPGDGSIARAAQVLRDGGAVAFPTETVYGLGALTMDPRGIARVYELKGRPADNPLIAHVLDAAGARAIAEGWDARCDELAARLWPGPLTMVLARRAGVPAAAAGGRASIAVRSPAHPVARRLLQALGGAAVSAPSANRSGRISATSAPHVAQEFADEPDLLVIDGGPCELGLESTVVDLTGPRPVLLRPGTVTLEALRAILGEVDAPHIAQQLQSPGTAHRHYAPTTPAELAPHGGLRAALAAQPRPCAVLCFDESEVPAPHTAITMPRDGQVYARALYDALRTADAMGCSRIVIERPAGTEGVWRAIADRLVRATAR
ncbi:MAG: L-threonylcarbamoyladenylate synthase [Phycisphaerales bacterium]